MLRDGQRVFLGAPPVLVVSMEVCKFTTKRSKSCGRRTAFTHKERYIASLLHF